ncbi:MAG: hypothetical protein GY720_15395 [bacterium]|nr:hypothetical protein [bacterium]
MTATRSFQRSNELLATVAASDAQHLMARRRQSIRRRRLLLFLSIGAVTSLGAALVTGSVLPLGITIGFDLAIGAYVMLLLMTRQRSYALANTPRIGAPSVGVAEAPAPRRESNQPSTVRVVAG